MTDTQHRIQSQKPALPQDAALDDAIAALQAVVLAQKAQIDVLLVSLEALLGSLNSPALREPSPARLPTLQADPSPYRDSVGSAPLGNPQDPQFASLHQLMARLRLG